MKKDLFGLSVRVASVVIAAACLGAPSMARGAVDNSPVVQPAGSPGAPALSYGVSEVMKMYRSGIGKDVIVNYINNSVVPYQLNADGIIYLQSAGVPQEITSAMISRDGQMRQQTASAQMAAATASAYPALAPSPAPPAQSEPIVVPTTPAPVVQPSVTYIGADYGYPYYNYYDYPYSYWPIGGWGWGWGGWGWGGRGYGGFRGGFGGGGFRGGFGGGGFHGGGFGGHGGGHR